MTLEGTCQVFSVEIWLLGFCLLPGMEVPAPLRTLDLATRTRIAGHWGG